MNNYELIGGFRCSHCGRFVKYDKRTFKVGVSQDYYTGYTTYVTHKKCLTKERKEILRKI